MDTNGNLENFVEIKDHKIELEGITLLNLNEIRKWTHFLSILGFVAIGLLLFLGVIMFVISSVSSSFQYDQFRFLGPFFGVAYLILALVYFFPVLYMYQFSKYAKYSLVQIGSGGSSNELMARAIDYLKKHFRYVGIFTIVILSVYLLVIIGVVIAAILK